MSDEIKKPQFGLTVEDIKKFNQKLEQWKEQQAFKFVITNRQEIDRGLFEIKQGTSCYPWIKPSPLAPPENDRYEIIGVMLTVVHPTPENAIFWFEFRLTHPVNEEFQKYVYPPNSKGIHGKCDRVAPDARYRLMFPTRDAIEYWLNHAN